MTTSTPVVEQNPSKTIWWIRSIRPKTLVISFMPMMLGTLFSGVPYDNINWTLFFYAFSSAVSIQIGMHLLNDAVNVKQVNDFHDRIGPIRGVHVGALPIHELFRGAMGFFLLAFIFSIPLMLHSGWIMAFVVLSSITFGVLYSAGPYPISHSKFAELLVIVYYGLIACASTAYLQNGMVSNRVLLAGLQVGFLASVIHAIQNLRDCEEDKRAKRRTIPVKYGVQAARWQILILLMMPYVLNLGWLWVGDNLMFILPMMTLPIALNIVHRIWKYTPSKIYNKFFGEMGLLHVVFTTMLIVGYLL